MDSKDMTRAQCKATSAMKRAIVLFLNMYAKPSPKSHSHCNAPCPLPPSPLDLVFTRDIISVLTPARRALSTRTPATPMAGIAISGAAISRPKKRAPCRVAAFSVMALSRTLCGTWFGMSAVTVGSWTARKPPPRNARTATCQSCTVPEITSAARIAVTTKLASSMSCARVRRSMRSANKPPNGETMRKGIIEANVMMPTQPDESDLLNVNHELATMKVHIAAPENMFAVQVMR